MTRANGAQHEADYIAEVTFGTTPATPAMTLIRHSGMSLALTKDSLQSDEVRSDRQIADFRHGNRTVGGDISAELTYGEQDDFLEAALGGTWAVDTPSAGIDQLKVGETLTSFTIRRFFSDITQYEVFTGVRFSGLAISVQPNQISTITFTCNGQDMSTTNLTGATQNPANTNTPFSGHEAGDIKEGGITYAGITGIELALDNGLESAFELGSDTTGDHIIGRSNVTGTVTAYFENSTLLDKFLNETESSIEFTQTDLDGNTLRFVVPKIKYTGGQPDVSGEGAILLSLPFQGLYDATTSTNFYIERNPV
jgi:hypothetical protein